MEMQTHKLMQELSDSIDHDILISTKQGQTNKTRESGPISVYPHAGRLPARSEEPPRRRYLFNSRVRGHTA